QIRLILPNGPIKTDSIMRLFWPITGQIGIYTIRKEEAARTRIWGSNGHYMGVNFRVFWQIKGFIGSDSGELQSDGFTGVFPGAGTDSRTGIVFSSRIPGLSPFPA